MALSPSPADTDHAGRVPRLFFLHVPKTAGSSLIRHLERDWWPGSVLELPDNHLALPTVREASARLPLVLCGHQSYPFAVALRPGGVITMLREPIARCISAYEYVIRTFDHPLHSQFRTKAGARSITDVTSDPNLSFHFGDMQTRMLGARFDMQHLANPAALPVMSLTELTHRMTVGEAEPVDATMLRRAKERMDEMLFVGVSDRFAESLELFAQRFDVSVPRVPEHLKRSPTPPRASRLSEYGVDDLDYLRSVNEYDSDLYRYASALFERRIAGLHATPTHAHL